jgi:hypothetical protein
MGCTNVTKTVEQLRVMPSNTGAFFSGGGQDESCGLHTEKTLLRVTSIYIKKINEAKTRLLYNACHGIIVFYLFKSALYCYMQ